MSINIQVIGRTRLHDIIQRPGDPTNAGRFLCLEEADGSPTLVGCDNSTGDAWTEEFSSVPEAMKWLHSPDYDGRERPMNKAEWAELWEFRHIGLPPHLAKYAAVFTASAVQSAFCTKIKGDAGGECPGKENCPIGKHYLEAISIAEKTIPRLPLPQPYRESSCDALRLVFPLVPINHAVNIKAGEQEATGHE